MLGASESYGSLIVAPGLSHYCPEERLLRSAQSILGSQIARFLTPPRGPDTQGSQTNWFDESRQIGVPVAPFPRWMVCSKCRLLAPISSGLFEPKVFAYRPHRACYVHNCATQGRSPLVVPARFMVTCEHGHLDDFPWINFVHKGPTNCKGLLYLYEVGASGEALDVEVKCDGCGSPRRMGQAFGPNNRTVMPACRGRRPHLRDVDPNGCDQEHVKPMLQGASNLWFPVLISALSVPQASDDLGRLVEENWAVLDKVTSIDVLKAFRLIGQLKDFSKYNDDQIWAAVQKKIQGNDEGRENPDDLKSPEWKVFSNPTKAKESRTFKLRIVDPPTDFTKHFEKIVLVEKLREVRALVGFTRIMSPRDFDSPAELPPEQRAKISRKDPTWVPACETRGEGIFFQFAEAMIKDWVKRNHAYDREFELGHEAWRATKNLEPNKGYPGIRYVLLHTFAHALIRQLAIECGYTSASITERIYSRNPADGDPMAGVLIYTAAPDSEGTLGGLCALGEPERLGRHIRGASEKMRLCASDPLCSEHTLGSGDTLHGASCHACSFLPETSCERGNKYLDRSAVVSTVERTNLAFFE
ncbi:MAG: DrmB family protein [Pyrinomonadaceae bacterium]